VYLFKLPFSALLEFLPYCQFVS